MFKYFFYKRYKNNILEEYMSNNDNNNTISTYINNNSEISFPYPEKQFCYFVSRPKSSSLINFVTLLFQDF